MKKLPLNTIEGPPRPVNLNPAPSEQEKGENIYFNLVKIEMFTPRVSNCSD